MKEMKKNMTKRRYFVVGMSGMGTKVTNNVFGSLAKRDIYGELWIVC